MTSTKIQIRNVEKAAKHDARRTGKITVRFPFNDYNQGNGRVFTGEPVEARVPRFRDGAVFVKYDNREFQVEPHARLLVKGYKAEIFWRTI
jgi:hypothetical protein